MMSPAPSIELILTEMTELRSEIGDVAKLPERWGAIMLPLSAGILALAVNSIKDMPAIAVGFMAFLAISTIIVWRLVGYNVLYRIRVLSERLAQMEKQIPQEVAKVLYDPGWRRWMGRPGTFLPFLSQRVLLDLLALLYILASAGLVLVKVVWF